MPWRDYGLKPTLAQCLSIKPHETVSHPVGLHERAGLHYKPCRSFKD